MRAFFLYSLDKLLRIIPSCISQLEFPVVSGRHAISKYMSLFGTFFMWNQISACFIFTWPEQLYPFLSAIYLDLVSYPVEPSIGQVNVTCPVGSTLSWSAEFKYWNISANVVCLRRLATSQRQLSRGGKAVMFELRDSISSPTERARGVSGDRSPG
jgi:hypothetical protein